jgi:methylglutaconyl-CoA hydratase
MDEPMNHYIQTERKDEVLTVTLNRPEARNAFNEELIEELTKCFVAISHDSEVRVVVLTGAGSAFCAGADLHWMKKMARYSKEENYADARQLDQMFYTIDICPKPVVAKVNGAAMAGGIGLVAVSDLVVAIKDAMFGFTEVKLGLVPAVVSPYVLRKTGLSQMRELFLIGERFSASRAKEIGLVYHVVEAGSLDQQVAQFVEGILENGPAAQAACKAWIHILAESTLEKAREQSTRLIAELRVSSEGQEGLGALLEKRKPAWTKQTRV